MYYPCSSIACIPALLYNLRPSQIFVFQKSLKQRQRKFWFVRGYHVASTRHRDKFKIRRSVVINYITSSLWYTTRSNWTFPRVPIVTNIKTQFSGPFFRTPVRNTSIGIARIDPHSIFSCQLFIQGAQITWGHK